MGRDPSSLLTVKFRHETDLDVLSVDLVGVGEGDQVVSRYTIRGTHRGETEDFGPPTGRQIVLEGITIHRFEGDKIVEE